MPNVGNRSVSGPAPVHWITPKCVIWVTRSGKTSILLHYAYRVALRGGSVLFLCQRAKIEQVPPLLPPGVDGQDGAFSRVHMRCSAELSLAAHCKCCLCSIQNAFQHLSCMHARVGTCQLQQIYRRSLQACTCWISFQKQS